MEYKLYTLVDITHTGQYRNEPGKEVARWQEQNFNTVLQTIGLRSNVDFRTNPEAINVSGKLVGLEIEDIVKVWRFDFYTDQDFVFEQDDNPVGILEELFDAVPFITGLTEKMEKRWAVFVTQGPNRNIVFHAK